MRAGLEHCLNIDDLRRLAKRRLPQAVFDYLDGAAGDEVTLRRNHDDFNDYEFLPHSLVDVADVALQTRVLNTDIALPVMMAPTGMSRLFHHQGEIAVARAAHRAGTIYSLSSMATYSIEELAAQTSGPVCFQIYVWRERELVEKFIQRCKEAGYTSLCLTVDFATAGQRERDLRNGFTVPPRIGPRNIVDALRCPHWLWHLLTTPKMALANIREHADVSEALFSVIQYTRSQFDPSLTWDDVRWMQAQWQGPFAIKGILNPDDARRAVASGIKTIIVSNHGGRQLDHAATPIGILPEIVAAVGNKAEVILDGGIRRGTDVVKALCLGARAVMIGRAYLYGLGAGGEQGVDRALAILKQEIKQALMLLGCRSVQALDQRYIRRRQGNCRLAS